MWDLPLSVTRFLWRAYDFVIDLVVVSAISLAGVLSAAILIGQ